MFSRQSLLAVLAASAAIMGGVEAFAPPARSMVLLEIADKASKTNEI